MKRSMGFMVGMTKNGDLWKASSITSLDSLALESDMANAGDQGTATQTQPTRRSSRARPKGGQLMMATNPRPKKARPASQGSTVVAGRSMPIRRRSRRARPDRHRRTPFRPPERDRTSRPAPRRRPRARPPPVRL